MIKPRILDKNQLIMRELIGTATHEENGEKIEISRSLNGMSIIIRCKGEFCNLGYKRYGWKVDRINRWWGFREGDFMKKSELKTILDYIILGEHLSSEEVRKGVWFNRFVRTVENKKKSNYTLQDSRDKQWK